MSAPSLGYEENTTLLRSEVAQVQLVSAIELFVEGRFLPALTLAGAAEEVLGKLLTRRSILPVVKESVQAIKDLRERTGLAVMGNRSESELISHWNTARNSAKHLNQADDETLTLNLCDEAYWMIRRALENAERLGVLVPNKVDFENWVIVNVAS